MKALRVLIVEDHADTAATIATWVELAGHAVQCVRTGFQALQAAPTFQPNVILLDIGLPDMDGWDWPANFAAFPGSPIQKSSPSLDIRPLKTGANPRSQASISI